MSIITRVVPPPQGRTQMRAQRLAIYAEWYGWFYDQAMTVVRVGEHILTLEHEGPWWVFTLDTGRRVRVQLLPPDLTIDTGDNE